MPQVLSKWAFKASILLRASGCWCMWAWEEALKGRCRLEVRPEVALDGRWRYAGPLDGGMEERGCDGMAARLMLLKDLWLL